MGHCLFMRKGETHTAPISGILASDLAVGSSVYLMENGVATEYLVVNQGIPSDSSLYDASCDGLWLLRKDIKENREWGDSSNYSYMDSPIDLWLDGDFFKLFGSVEQSIIKKVKIPYISRAGKNGVVYGGENGLSTRVFLLSEYEVGCTSYSKGDGAKLDYFLSGRTDTNAMEKRKAQLNGSDNTWWMRSVHKSTTGTAVFVQADGSVSYISYSNSYGIRPALILPHNALFDKNTLILKGVK